MLEEAQLFLPQQIYKGDEHMVGIWNEIVRLGRNCGIGVSLITQRPQSVTKEALTQVECLVVLQVNGVPEKKALKEWIVEKGADTNLLEELPFLKQGVAYVWSPQWLEHFGKHEILPKWTFDSGATPKSGKTKVKAELKPLDLDALKAQMAETVKRLEANDPVALKKRVQELERTLAKSLTSRIIEKAEKAPKADLRSEKRLLRAAAVGATVALRLDRLIEKLASAGAEFMAATKNLKSPVIRPGYALGVTKDSQAPVRFIGTTNDAGFLAPKKWKVASDDAPKNGHTNGEFKVVGKMRDMLAVLVNGSLSRDELSCAVAQSQGGTFSTYVSRLKQAGYVAEDGGVFTITTAGIQQVSQPLSMTGDAILERNSDIIVGKMKNMVQVIRGSDGLTRAQLSESVQQAQGGTFSTYVSRLKTRGIIEESGGVFRLGELLQRGGG